MKKFLLLLLLLAIPTATFAEYAGGGRGGLNGVTVTDTPSGAGKCLVSLGVTTADWGSCSLGTITGPGTTTLHGVPVYSSTDGTTVVDSVLTSVGALFGGGDGVDNVGTNLGFGFAGSPGGTPLVGQGTTGWKVIPNVSGGRDALEEYIDGVQTWFAYPNDVVYQVRLRPDSSVRLELGASSAPWGSVYGSTFIGDGTQSEMGRHVILSTLYTGQVSNPPWGIGLNSTSGTEFYLKLSPDGGSHYVELFNVVSTSTTGATVSAPTHTASNGVNAVSLTLKGANNTGDADAGDLILATAASSSGVAGNVYVPKISGGPTTPHIISNQAAFWYDPAKGANGSICVDDAGTPKCAAVTP